MYRTLRESIYIDAPLESVWQLYDDPEQLKRWAPNVLDARVLGDAGKRVGAKIEVTLRVGGLKQRLVEEIVHYEPPYAATQRGRSPGMAYDVAIVLTRDTGGTWCGYSCAPAYEGWARLLAPVGDWMNRRMLRSALLSLKAAAERARPSDQPARAAE
jgi:carbon monoxide dehydrogenase subunit G